MPAPSVPPAPADRGADVPEAVAWVALGANLGRLGAALARVRAALATDGVSIDAASREVLTRAVGVVRQPDFLNQVVRLRADPPLPPSAWLTHCHGAELAAGRRPTYRWGPRRADADLVLLGADGSVRIDSPDLVIPHPALAGRPFLCALLAELDPTLHHPDGRLLADLGGVFAEPPAAATPEERIHAVTVGEVVPLDGPIRLDEYDPAWPHLFAREAARIRACLGARVLVLEHTGSTSVPGLAAKPIIDMLLVVADSGDEAAYVPALESAGYTVRIREPDWHQHRVLKGPDTNVNLHVLSRGSPEVERILAFRDRLRADPADRALYERTKRELAARHWTHVQHYADAKTRVIESIITRALHPDP